MDNYRKRIIVEVKTKYTMINIFLINLQIFIHIIEIFINLIEEIIEYIFEFVL